MGFSGESWVFEWMDEFEIHSLDALEKCLQSPVALQKLHDLGMESGQDESSRVPTWPEPTLLGGEGFNLFGVTTCAGYGCLVAQVDEAIAAAWHYFDRIVVSAPSGEYVASRIGETPKKARARLLNYIRDIVALHLYIRDIGAEKRISFLDDRPDHCTECVRNHAAEMGLASAVDDSTEDQVVAQLAREATITTERTQGGWVISFDHPYLDEPMYRYFGQKLTPSEISRVVFREHVAAAVGDYVKSRSLNLPLATKVKAAWLRHPQESNQDAIADRMGRVALKLSLPMVNGISTKDLLLFLEDERPNFVRFQAALRKAISEQISRLDSKSDAEIAVAVWREFIEPELEDVRRRMSAVKKLLSKKVSAGLAIGALTTSVGLIVAMPLVVATGVAAGATAIPQLYKYFDDRASVELSDMYFLWELQNKYHGELS